MVYTLPAWVRGQQPLVNPENLGLYNTAINDLDTRVATAQSTANLYLTPIATVAALRALTSGTSVQNGAALQLRGYRADADGGQSIVYYDSLDTTTADDSGRTFVDAAGRRWKRLLENPSIFNVMRFGAQGLGSGSATNDQAGFLAAMTAVNAAGGGTLYMPVAGYPSGYYLSGGFTQNAGVHVLGAGKMICNIVHTGANTLFNGTGVPPSLLHTRSWRSFSVDGTLSSSSAEGIRAGDAYGMIFSDLMLWHYGGSCINIQNTSTSQFTEGTSLYDVMTRDSARGIRFSRTSGAAASMSNTAMYNVVMVMNNTGQVGMDVGAGSTNDVDLYGSYFDIKTHADNVANTYGIDVGQNSLIRRGRLNWLHEVWNTTGYPLRTATGAKVTMDGYLQYADTSGIPDSSQINSGSDVQIGGFKSMYGRAPSATAGAAAGTSPTITVSGTDHSGYVSIATGTSPNVAADGTVATVTFDQTWYPAAPKSIILTPSNSAAANLSATQPYVDRSTITTTQFVIKKPSASALAASTTYEFFYQVVP